MKTPAIVSTLTVVGSLAFAAGKDHALQPRLPVSDTPVVPGHSRVAAAGACQPSLTEDWLSPVFRPISSPPWCPYWSEQMPRAIGQPFNAADVNGDGTFEYFVGQVYPIVSASAPYPGCVAAESRMMTVAGELEESHVCILRASSVGTVILERYPGLSHAEIWTQGWRDMDADGDLDLVGLLRGESPQQPDLFVLGWFENVGFEQPTPPVAADLNEDGNVDGVDLGILLASWGAHS